MGAVSVHAVSGWGSTSVGFAWSEDELLLLLLLLPLSLSLSAALPSFPTVSALAAASVGALSTSTFIVLLVAFSLARGPSLTVLWLVVFASMPSTFSGHAS